MSVKAKSDPRSPVAHKDSLALITANGIGQFGFHLEKILKIRVVILLDAYFPISMQRPNMH